MSFGAVSNERNMTKEWGTGRNNRGNVCVCVCVRQSFSVVSDRDIRTNLYAKAIDYASDSTFCTSDDR